MYGRVQIALAAACALLPLPAFAQTTEPEPETVTVTGSLDRMSPWYMAEGDHVVVYSDGDPRQLSRIAHNLERLHFLLSILLDRLDATEDAQKLRITLVGNSAEFDAMDLRNIRSQQGPYVQAFPVQRYYDPREDGAVMAASRFDQVAQIEPGQQIDLNGIGGSTLDPQTGQVNSALFGSDLNNRQVSTTGTQVPLTAEGRIYGAYAQHFLLTYRAAAYPRWYVDGFGELFSTINVRPDGTVEYGKMPEGYRKVLEQYPTVAVKDVVTGRYLAIGPKKTRWNPFHAWILTHYLFFSDERRPQLSRYLASIGRGATMEQAASVFGDLDKLQAEVRAYDNKKLVWERMTYPPERAPEPLVTRLNRGQAMFLKGRIEVGSRVAIPDGEGRAQALAARDRWLEKLRGQAAANSGNLEAQLLLAEAECRSGNNDRCAAAADRATAIAPSDARGLAWKGVALEQQAAAAPAAERAARMKAARAAIAKANRADTEASLPLLAFYRSYADVGEAPPAVAAEGVLKAVQNVPAAPGPRVMMGAELAREGHPDGARAMLMPVINGAYDSPERAQGEAVAARLPAE